MPYTTLADLRSMRVKARITVRGMPINLDYDPDVLTGNRIRQLVAQERAQERATSQAASQAASREAQTAADVEALAAFLVDAIVSWDLVERAPDEGCEPDYVPLTVERLMDMGVLLLRDITQALGSGMRLGELNGTSSPRRSSRTPTKARRVSSRH